MRILLLLSLSVSLAASAALAQGVPTPTVLFNFEGAGGDTQGWEPDVAPDVNLGENARSLVRTVDSKAVGMVNGEPASINAYNGTWLLEAVPNRPIKADAFRGMKYTWTTPQDWTATPVLKLAASMQANGSTSELHQYRIRVISGTGATADTTEMIYDGLKSEGAEDATDFNSFVNDWEVLTFDLSDFAGLSSVTGLEAAGRHADDANSGGTPIAAEVNWGGLAHLDYVTVEAAAGTAVEGAPGLSLLSEAFPNPSSLQSRFLVAVEVAQRVTATVHDVLGRVVQTPLDGALTPGESRAVVVNTSPLAAGTYVVRFRGETFVQARRLTVAR